MRDGGCGIGRTRAEKEKASLLAKTRENGAKLPEKLSDIIYTYVICDPQGETDTAGRSMTCRVVSCRAVSVQCGVILSLRRVPARRSHIRRWQPGSHLDCRMERRASSGALGKRGAREREREQEGVIRGKG